MTKNNIPTRFFTRDGGDSRITKQIETFSKENIEKKLLGVAYLQEIGSVPHHHVPEGSHRQHLESHDVELHNSVEAEHRRQYAPLLQECLRRRLHGSLSSIHTNKRADFQKEQIRGGILRANSRKTGDVFSDTLEILLPFPQQTRDTVDLFSKKLTKKSILAQDRNARKHLPS